MCQGQLKSRVECPDCKKDSITFDPFMFLSVPLPQTQDKLQEVIYVSANWVRRPPCWLSSADASAELGCSAQPGDAKANVPTVYGVKMSKMGSAADLKAGLAKLVGHNSKASSMLVCEVWSNKLFKVFPHDASVSRIQPRDEIWVYECPVLAENEAEERAAREAKDGKDVKHENWISIQITNSATNKKQKKSGARLIGTPFVVAVPESKIRSMNIQELRDIVARGVTPFLKGGWAKDEKDSDLYSIHLMDKPGHELILDVPQKVSFLVAPGLGSMTSSPVLCRTARSTSPPRLARAASASACSGTRRSPASATGTTSPCATTAQAESTRPSVVVCSVLRRCCSPYRLPCCVLRACSDEGKKGDGLSVYDCVEAFTGKETLRPTEAWYCPTCKKHQCAEKKFDLWRLPDTLIIHLKRFNYNRVWRDKVCTLLFLRWAAVVRFLALNFHSPISPRSTRRSSSPSRA
jgi:hypothetical protein